MQKYLIIIEKADENYSAYSPDLPGCVATGETREETVNKMTEAIEMHLEGLVEDNLPIPKPETSAEMVEVNFQMETI